MGIFTKSTNTLKLPISVLTGVIQKSLLPSIPHLSILIRIFTPGGEASRSLTLSVFESFFCQEHKTKYNSRIPQKLSHTAYA